jgi:hypothetical protein
MKRDMGEGKTETRRNEWVPIDIEREYADGCGYGMAGERNWRTTKRMGKYARVAL